MLGRNIVFSCRDSALLLYRDDVATKVSMSRPRWSRQEFKCCNKFGLGCKTRENSNFLKKGKMVISVKIRNFLDHDKTDFIVGIFSRNLATTSNSEIVGISRFSRHRVSGAV